MRLPSAANLREHWAVRAKRAKGQRERAWLHVRGALPLATLQRARVVGAIIELVRVAPRKLDSDNLASAFKAVRDGVADCLGIDDGDERLEWRYSQRRGKPGELAVEIEIMVKA